MDGAKVGIVMLGIVLALAAAAMRADAPRADDAAKENAELRAKVEALQRRNAELNAKVEAMQADARRLRAAIEDARDHIEWLEKARQELKGIEGLRIVPTQPAQPPVMVVPKEENRKMPPGTVERKFNGVSVYVVPLE